MANVYFVSGPMTWAPGALGKEERKWYETRITKILVDEPEASFVCGAAQGADALCQDFLTMWNLVYKMGLPDAFDRIKVFRRRGKPDYLANPRIITDDTSESWDERDAKLTAASTHDIAYERPAEVARIMYGDKYDPSRETSTQKNIKRRAALRKG